MVIHTHKYMEALKKWKTSGSSPDNWSTFWMWLLLFIKPGRQLAIAASHSQVVAGHCHGSSGVANFSPYPLWKKLQDALLNQVTTSHCHKLSFPDWCWAYTNKATLLANSTLNSERNLRHAIKNLWKGNTFLWGLWCIVVYCLFILRKWNTFLWGLWCIVVYCLFILRKLNTFQWGRWRIVVLLCTVNRVRANPNPNSKWKLNSDTFLTLGLGLFFLAVNDCIM